MNLGDLQMMVHFLTPEGRNLRFLNYPGKNIQSNLPYPGSLVRRVP